MSAIDAEKALYEDLLSIYARAGAEVTYETEKGDTKAYWAKRFLQATKRAEKNGELVEFAERLVSTEEPSRGFFILKKAGRLDLTVEVLVIDETRPYWGEFDHGAVEASRRRLADHGYAHAFSSPPPEESGDGTEEPVRSGEIQLAPGTSFDLRVTVESDGKLSISLA
jgi:hypothetical protein